MIYHTYPKFEFLFSDMSVLLGNFVLSLGEREYRSKKKLVQKRNFCILTICDRINQRDIKNYILEKVVLSVYLVQKKQICTRDVRNELLIVL